MSTSRTCRGQYGPPDGPIGQNGSGATQSHPPGWGGENGRIRWFRHVRVLRRCKDVIKV